MTGAEFIQALPARLFWDVDPARLDAGRNAVFIIARIMDRGTKPDVDLAPVDMLEGIRMASLSDIAAMKLNAISNRGSKKDFWDYARLLDCYQHQEMLEFFSLKYAAFNLWHVEKSVVYFDDAELDPDPVDLVGQTWEDVKKTITSQCLKG